MKSIREITNSLLHKSETPRSPEPTTPEPTPPQRSPEEPSATPKNARNNPLRAPWQRKWLDMEVHHRDIQTAADAVMKFCSRWSKLKPEGPTLLVLQGPTGCGKTRMASRVSGWASAVAFTVYCEARSASSSVPTVRFVDWVNVCTPEKLDERSWLDLLSEIDTDSLTVIDDIGCEVDRFKSGAHIERLCMILNRRAGKFTLVTTNHRVETWVDVWDARVSDRLLRDSQVIVMNSPSYASFV